MTKEELKNLKPGALVWVIWSDKILKAKFICNGQGEALHLDLLREIDGESSNKVAQHLNSVFLKKIEAADCLISRYLERASAKRRAIADTVKQVNDLESEISELQKLRDRADLEEITAEWFNKLASLVKEAPSSSSAKDAVEKISGIIIERVKD